MGYKFIEFENIPAQIKFLYDSIKRENPELNIFQIVDTIIFELAIEITNYNYRKTTIYGCLLAKISNSFKDKPLIILKNGAVIDEIIIGELISYILSSPKEFHKDMIFYARNSNLLENDDPSLSSQYAKVFLLPKSSFLETPHIQVPDSFSLDYVKNLSKSYVNSYLKLTSRNRYSTEEITDLIISQLD